MRISAACSRRPREHAAPRSMGRLACLSERRCAGSFFESKWEKARARAERRLLPEISFKRMPKIIAPWKTISVMGIWARVCSEIAFPHPEACHPDTERGEVERSAAAFHA